MRSLIISYHFWVTKNVVTMIGFNCCDCLFMEYIHYRSPHWGNPWGTPCCFWQGSILHQDQGGLHFVEAHQGLQRCWPGLQNKENESRKGKNEESTKDYEERTIGDIWSRPGNIPKLQCPVIFMMIYTFGPCLWTTWSMKTTDTFVTNNKLTKIYYFSILFNERLFCLGSYPGIPKFTWSWNSFRR